MGPEPVTEPFSALKYVCLSGHPGDGFEQCSQVWYRQSPKRKDTCEIVLLSSQVGNIIFVSFSLEVMLHYVPDHRNPNMFMDVLVP